MGKRAVAAAVAVLLGCFLVSSCHSGPTVARSTAPAAQASETDTAAVSEARAVEALRTWLDKPLPGTLTLSSVETDSAKKIVTSRQLTGRLDPTRGTASLTGTLNVLGSGPAVQDPMSVIVAGGKVFSSIPPGDLHRFPGRTWFVDDLSVARAAGSPHSIWWLALQGLDKVHLDGASEVDTKSAVEYTGTVDLAKIPAVTDVLPQSLIVQKAGTTKVSIDLYTDLGTGALVQLTYRLGLQVSVDATPTGHSMAGYEVDFSGFGTPVKPSPSPVVAPVTRLVASHSGSSDLCQLLLF
ncbi:hypothetical protein [Actinocrinis puniceicyclus]|nr:hypothetical protein [Actinocrinis puniceicyclus]